MAEELLKNLVCYYNMVKGNKTKATDCDSLKSGDIEEFIAYYKTADASASPFVTDKLQGDNLKNIVAGNNAGTKTFDNKPYILRAAMLMYLNSKHPSSQFMKNMKEHYKPTDNNIIKTGGDQNILYDYYVMAHLDNSTLKEEYKLLWEYMKAGGAITEADEIDPLNDYIKAMKTA